MNAHLDMAQLRREAEQLDQLCGGDDQLFADMMEGETDVHRIVARIHEQYMRDEEMALGIKERQAALAERRKRIETRAANGKAMIGKVLRIARLPNIELPEATYSVRDGKPVLKVVDPAAVPEMFTVTKPAPDKRAINEAYHDSDSLPNWLVREPATDVVTARKV